MEHQCIVGPHFGGVLENGLGEFESPNFRGKFTPKFENSSFAGPASCGPGCRGGCGCGCGCEWRLALVFLFFKHRPSDGLLHLSPHRLPQALASRGKCSCLLG